MAIRTKVRPHHPEEKRARTVTLQDVAQVAGVTSMTVSRVVKGTGYVADATRERVLRVAEELGYTANLAARALATGKTGVIAVISGNLNQPYYAKLVHLLETHITASGYRMRLLHTHSDLDDLISSTHSSAVDGVIIAGKYHLAEEFRALAPQVFRSCVFIDTSEHPDTDHVHSNLVPAVEEALELMIAAGRTRIAYVGHFDQGSIAPSPAPPYPTPIKEERLQTYQAFMQKKGCPTELIGVVPSSPLTRETLRHYLQQHGCPEGLLCVNDETAMYVYRALRDAGYGVPTDALLVGCDGLSFMECFDPPLSTIAPPTDEICALAWQFLQARITHPALAVQKAAFAARLIVRQSLQSQAHTA